MNKVISRIVAFILVVNVFVPNVGFNLVQADEIEDFLIYVQNKSNYPSDFDLNTIGITTDPVYFKLDNFSEDHYLLSYHVNDYKEIQVTIERKITTAANSLATVTYKVLDLSKDEPVEEDNYDKVYNDTIEVFNGVEFVEIRSPNFRRDTTQTSNIVLDGDDDFNENQTEIKFNLSRSYYFIFRINGINGETIYFRWVGGTGGQPDSFDFMTSAPRPEGKYYDFNLKSYNRSNVLQREKSVIIFTGWGGSALTSQRFADDDVMPSNDDGRYLDHVTYDNAPDPGENPGLKLKLSYPSYWDPEKKMFVQIDPSAPDFNPMQDNANIDIALGLGSYDKSGTGFDISLRNIYSFHTEGGVEDALTASTTESKVKIVARRIFETVNGKNIQRIEISLSNIDDGDVIQPSVIYDTTSITLTMNFDLSSLLPPSTAETKYFVNISDITAGQIYTYLRYYIVGSATDKFTLYIQPYKLNTGALYLTGEYYVQYSDSDNPLNPGDVATAFKDYRMWNYKAGDAAPIAISLDLSTTGNSANSTKWFQILFRPLELAVPGNTILSQGLRYRPDEKSIVRGAPENFQILSSKIVTDKTDKKYLSLEMLWETGPHDGLNKLRHQSAEAMDESSETFDGQIVTYYFGKSLSPLIGNRADFMWIDVRLSPDGDGDGTVINLDDITLNAKNNPDVKLKTGQDYTFYTPNYRSERDTGGNMVYFGAIRATVSIPVTPKEGGEESIENALFEYPSVYFIDIGNEYDVPVKSTPPGGGVIYELKKTNPGTQRTIILDDVEKYEVPAPKILTISHTQNNEQKAFDLEWSPITLANYRDFERYMLQPKDRYIGSDSITYNIYISQSFDKIKATDSANRNVHESLMEALNPIEYQATDIANIAEDLRDGELVKIAGIEHRARETETFTVSNLDKNQPYYTLIEAVITPYELQFDENDDPILDNEGNQMSEKNTEKAEYSKPSDTLSITTTIDPEQPKPGEVTPITPTGLIADELIKPNSSTIYWDRQNQPPQNSEYRIEYQILRTTVGALKGTDINYETEKISLDKLLPKLEEDREGIKYKALQTQNTSIYEYNPTLTTTDKLEDPEDGSYIYEVENPNNTLQHLLTDSTLSPNTIYYFYVRTITVEMDEEGRSSTTIINYSNWTGISITTPPVEKPINLRVERDKIQNPKTEMIISFDAAVTPERLQTDSTTGQWFEYSLKKEGEPWGAPVAMTTTQDIEELVNSATPATTPGYFRYEYTIKQSLTPGTSYSIRVRVYDKELKDYSQYSDIRTHKTTSDEEENEQKEDKDSANEELKRRLAQLIKFPYWKITDEEDEFEAVYRSSMFDGEILNSTSNTITLGKTGPQHQIYYIPAQILVKANTAGKNLQVSAGTVSTIITANSITEKTEAIKSQQTAVNEKEIKDYFIKITVELTSVYRKIEGNDPLTPEIETTIETIGSSEVEKKWDDYLFNLLLETIINDENMLSAASDEIENEIIDGATNEELLETIKELVEEVEEDMMNTVESELKDILEDNNTYEITTLEKPMTILAQINTNATVNAYQYLAGLWMRKDVTDYAGKKGFTTQQSGIYIFAGVAISLPGVSGLENGGNITNIITKYQLNDYLGNGTAFNINGNATTNMVAGIVARMAGAPKTTDIYQWLKNKGITTQSRNAANNIQTQEAIYLIMALYEIKTNTKVNSIRITNYNRLANIQIDARYKPSVTAAIEIGVVKTPIQPKSNITIRQLLEIIGALTPKAKL